ncbi:MAG: class I SAM-dependent methyltransferase [Luteitalea sp.]
MAVPPDDRSLTSRILGWVRGGERSGTDRARAAGPPVATKVLSKFIAAVAQRASPVVLDLGPVVGSNVSFLGEQLGCRLLVEDLYSDLDRLTRAGQLETLTEVLSSRLTYAPESFDAILCWDVFDYLDKPAAKALGQRVGQWVKPGGVVLCFFSTVANTAATYTRYVITDAQHLQHRTSPASHARRTVFQNRDIDRLFPGMAVTESVLLQNKTREILLRKPVPKA